MKTTISAKRNSFPKKERLPWLLPSLSLTGIRAAGLLVSWLSSRCSLVVIPQGSASFGAATPIESSDQLPGIPSAAKAPMMFADFMAGLKSRPFKK
jgi:hypothetical protein